MLTIEEYIELSKTMPNTSDGGSDSFRFEEDGVVLVKYSGTTKYGLAREGEEQIALAANRKNAAGIYTPKHIAYLRVEEGERNHCYVLQELAKGKCMVKYQAPYGDIAANIAGMKNFSNIPDFQIDKCLLDLISLHNMGLELKPKNFFYDSEIGFTFIDLLGKDETPADTTTLLGINSIFNDFRCALTQYSVTKYDEGVTEEQIDEFLEYKAILYNKMFNACAKNIPSFDIFKRYLYRSLEPGIKAKMIAKGYIDQNLSLTDSEVKDFNNRINEIIAKNLRDLEQGKNQYWNIVTNTIRIEIDSSSLSNTWEHHPDYPHFDIKDFNSKYERDRAQTTYLYEKIYEALRELIKKKAATSDNEFIQEANKEILEKEEQERQLKEIQAEGNTIGFW